MPLDSEIANITSAKAVFEDLHRRLGAEAVPDPAQARNAHLLLAALLYCRESCSLAVQAMRDQAHLHEHSLARPILDLSVRLLFAARVPDGWRRYWRYWAEDEVRWAKEAKPYFPSEPVFDRWIAEAEARRNELGVDKMPDRLPDVIREIFETEAAEREGGRDAYMATPDNAREANHMVFKVLHAVTHGSPDYLLEHLMTIAANRPPKTHGGTAYLQSAHFMLRAVYLFRGWPNREQDAMAVLHRFIPRPT